MDSMHEHGSFAWYFIISRVHRVARDNVWKSFGNVVPSSAREKVVQRCKILLTRHDEREGEGKRRREERRGEDRRGEAALNGAW